MKAILLTFDCLPLRLLGCYGNESIETPNFDRLAADSVVFDAHFGENFDAQAANHAWWTGCCQFCRTRDQQLSLPRIGRALETAGVMLKTASESFSLDPLNQDNATSWSGTSLWGGTKGLDADAAKIPFAHLVEAADLNLQELKHNSREPWLLWLSSRGMGAPSVPAPAFEELTLCNPGSISAGRPPFVRDFVGPFPLEADDSADEDWPLARAVYGNYVRKLDDCLGALIETIGRHVDDEDLLLILTASRGADLGERSATRAQPLSLCSSFVRVPLLVHLSGSEKGSRRRCLTQSIDLAPTLLEWFGIGLSDFKMQGRSLLPTLRGETEHEHTSLFLGAGTIEMAVRTRDFYLVETADHSPSATNSTRRLFVKPDDAFDILDVASQFPAVVDELQRELHGFVSAAKAARENENCS